MDGKPKLQVEHPVVLSVQTSAPTPTKRVPDRILTMTTTHLAYPRALASEATVESEEETGLVRG